MTAVAMRIIVSAGGTSGHIHPALAVAEEFRNMGHTVLFMGGLYGAESEKAKNAGFEFAGIDVRGFSRSNFKDLLVALFKLPGALLSAFGAVGRFAPHAVVGAGGYASGPALLAAWIKGIPLFLLEQNVFPGLVTRFMATKAKKVFTSFEGSEKWLAGADVMVTGNPILNADRFKSGTKEGQPVLLVTGGSQGARSINRAVVEAVPQLATLGLKVIHQTGKSYLEEAKAAYAQAGIQADVAETFNNMHELMANAHLAVTRAGASTCAELALCGLPAVMVPYPYAGGHQKLNAQVMAKAGAAVVMEDETVNGEKLFNAISELLGNKQRLDEMRKAFLSLARPNAARQVCSEVARIQGN